MEKKRKPDGYWKIKENIYKEALKYETRSEFRINCSNGVKWVVLLDGMMK
jgi:hypothetical protein